MPTPERSARDQAVEIVQQQLEDHVSDARAATMASEIVAALLGEFVLSRRPPPPTYSKVEFRPAPKPSAAKAAKRR